MAATATQAQSVEIPKFSPTRQALRYGRADERLYGRVYAEAPIVPETVEWVAEKGKFGREVADRFEFDAFNALNRNIVTPTGMGDELCRELLRRARESKDYAELRQNTVGDEVAAALGACGITEATAAALSEELKEKARKQREAQEKAEEVAGAAEAINEDPGATDDDRKAANEDAAKARKAAEAATVVLRAQMRGEGKAIQKAANAAVTKAKDETGAVNAAARAFGFGTGSMDPTGGATIEEKFKLARIVQRAGARFKKFVELLGRLSSTALRKQAERSHHEASEIVDVTQGNDVDVLLDDEIVQLVVPELADAALASFAGETMMQYELEAREPLAKGDIVVLIDESGSMAGEKEMEAKAIALALAHVAARQKRRLLIHFFQDTVTHTIEMSPKDARVEDGVNVALRKLGELAGRGTGGGTDFDVPLARAVKDVKDGYEKADILAITDGDCNVQPSTLKALNDLRAEKGAKVYTMLIGASMGSHLDTVRQFSDRVWNADSLVDSGAAEELFELV